jgi:hypothetical protein
VKLTDIQERISRCARHPGIPEASKAIHDCIDQLKELLLDCSVCHRSTFGSCASCVEIQKTIGWALERLRDSEAK